MPTVGARGSRSDFVRAVMGIGHINARHTPRADLVSGAMVLTVLALVTTTIAVTGGAPSALVHLYYLPILYSSARHGRLSTVIVATLAGLATGPWMPASHAPSGQQGLSDWGVRLALFVVVGVAAAWLAGQNPRPLDLIVRDFAMSRDLRSSVRHHRIKVHFQPLVDLRDGKVIGVEALCRWNDKRGLAVSPAVFIPAAEHTGAIIALGREVLMLAAAQSKRWAVVYGEGLMINVNVSALQLADPEFLPYLTAMVGKADERKCRLCVEITETAIIADPETAFTTLTALRDLG